MLLTIASTFCEKIMGIYLRDFFSKHKICISIFIFDLVIGLIAAHKGHPIDEYFREGRAMTLLSASEIFLTAIVCLYIFVLQTLQDDFLDINRKNILLWAGKTFFIAAAFGFGFLASDELLMFHEGIDFSVHSYFHIKETSLTDRLDDLIIILFGIVSCGYVYVAYKEIKRYPCLLNELLFAFALMAIMSVIDVLTNDDILYRRFIPAIELKNVSNFFETVEEIFKLLSEALFLGAFLNVLFFRLKNSNIFRNRATEGTNPENTIFSFINLTFLVYSLYVCTYIFIPSLNSVLYNEKSLISYLTITILLCSFFMSLRGIYLIDDNKYKRWYLSIPLISWWFLLEKVHYGEKMLDLTMPKVGGIEINGFRNIIGIFLTVLKDRHGYAALYIFSILLIIFILSSILYIVLTYGNGVSSFLSQNPSVIYLFISFFFFIMVVFIYTPLIKNDFISSSILCFELFASLGILYSSMNIRGICSK